MSSNIADRPDVQLDVVGSNIASSQGATFDNVNKKSAKREQIRDAVESRTYGAKKPKPNPAPLEDECGLVSLAIADIPFEDHVNSKGVILRREYNCKSPHVHVEEIYFRADSSWAPVVERAEAALKRAFPLDSEGRLATMRDLPYFDPNTSKLRIVVELVP